MEWITFGIPILVAALALLSSAIRILPEWERGVVLRLGRYHATKGPGLFFVIPIIDRVIRVNLRLMTFDVPPQEAITRDNVTVKVNAVVFYRVIDPAKAITQVEDFKAATWNLAQTTLRSVLGQSELDELLAHRDKVNAHLRQILDEATDSWGIKVVMVEVKDVELPQGMQRAMARQAEAEREKRAKIIHAEGEYQAAKTLVEAARMIASEPAALQLRYLQTLTEISMEKNSTIIFPVPVDTLQVFLGNMHRSSPGS